jgi:hypothetical protein
VVLVTLGGCHLLDGLMVVSVEAHKEDCVTLRRSDCEGYCAHPAGAMKSNSSRARREGRQVVWPCQVLELVVSTLGECDLRVTTSKRTGGKLGACLNGD